MKLLALVGLCLFASSSFAVSPKLAQTVLRKVTIDGKSEPRFVAFAKADVSTKTLTLRVMNDLCGHYDESTAGQIHCMAMPAAVVEITVPYTEKMDACRSTVLSGVDDRRASDGNRQEIQLIDNSTRVCENVIADLFEITATSTTARGNKTTTVTASGTPASRNRLPTPVLQPVVQDDKVIYDALKVEEIALNPGIAGFGRFSKTAGRLTCLKETLIVARANTKYSCTLK